MLMIISSHIFLFSDDLLSMWKYFMFYLYNLKK